MTPEEYLNSLNIDLKTTTLLGVVGEHLRQMDLCWIMESYAKIANKPKPMDLSIPEDFKSDHADYYPNQKEFNKK